jgi:hypothetical protein
MATSYTDKTPVIANRLVAIVDADASPLQNYQTITHFIKSMDLEDRIEMMLTLRAFINEALR